MPRKQPTSLFQTALSTVSKNLWNHLNYHREHSGCVECVVSYHPETCPALKAVKEWLTLPQCLLQCVYNKIASYDKFKFSRNNSDLLHLYCYFLEHSELKSHFRYSDMNCMLFVVKYGKYITSMSFLNSRDVDLPGFDLWKTIFFCTSNLQVLDLYNYEVNENLLELIGLECFQIREVTSCRFDENVTVKSIQKLIFNTRVNMKVKNKCCDTLEVFHVVYNNESDTEYSARERKRMNAIVSELVSNLKNLKSLGDRCQIEFYLSQLSVQQIPMTSLEEIYVYTMTHETPQLLKLFSPKMIKLTVFSDQSNGWNDMHSLFPCLKYLKIDIEIIEIYQIVVKSTWSFLKKITISLNNNVLVLHDFAKQLPMLEKLKVDLCESVAWNGKTYFKCLSDIHVCTCYPKSVNWFEAFADTIENIEITTVFEEPFHEDKCNILLTDDFPKLKYLSFQHFTYNYDFIVDVICTCPALKAFEVYLEDDETLNYVKEVSQFLKENNYECDFSSYLK